MDHELSYISPLAKIGLSVMIGRFCIIEDNVIVSDNVEIGDYSMILNGSKIGNGTKLGTYTKIGKNVKVGVGCNFTSFCEIRDDCELGNGVNMGSRCTLSAGSVVEDKVNIKYSFVMADTPDLVKDSQKLVGVLKEGSRFGANVTIMPGIIIGKNAEIGACSQVRNSVSDNEIWYGNPAKFYKKNTSE